MRQAAVLLLAAVTSWDVAVAQGAPAQRGTRPRTLAEDLQLFSQVLNQIRVNHPDTMDTHAMMMAAIDGMVRAVDPHTFVIPAVRLDSARQRALEDGKLAPVPIQFVFADGRPIVTSIGAASHAARQDIRIGDELVAVDGHAPESGSETELELELAGLRGSSVALRFLRTRTDGSEVTLDRVVKRETADDATAVPVARMVDATTGYVLVTTFANTRVDDDLRAAVQRLEGQGMRRLVLDLRDNGGGLVVAAGKVAGEFLPKGAVIYSTQGRKESVNRTERVGRSFWRRERSYPMVVLVNHGTASASELVAGALQDHDRALIVGRPTFGKALLMQGVPLTDGSLMMLVVGNVRTPCGRVVQRNYRGLRQVDYYRAAKAIVDTTGRPSCRTAAGRTVYGGGGIYPDVMLDRPGPEPLWLARLRESELMLKWSAAAALDSAAGPRTMDDLVAPNALTSAQLAAFRDFAGQNGATIPVGDEVDLLLWRALAGEFARARFGEAGYHRVMLAHDPWMAAALRSFEQASLLRGPDGK